MKRRNFFGFLLGGLVAPIATFTRPTILANKKDEISRGKEINLCRRKELAVALQVPLRHGVLSGDILENIFEKITLESGNTHEFPLYVCEIGRTKNEN